MTVPPSRQPQPGSRQARTLAWLREEGPPLAGLALVVAVLFRDALFAGRVFYLRDVHLQWHEQVESLGRALAAGAWPLWDPHVAFGLPMLANANHGLFYPVTWLCLLLPPGPYFTTFVVLHSLVGAVGVYALARQLGASRAGAFTAGAVWAASGPVLSMVNLWNHFAGAAWLPWSARAAARAAPVPLALSLAATLLVGSPDVFLMASLVALGLLARRARHERLRALGWRAAAAWGLALGLSAVQWLPTLELAMRGSRWGQSPAAASAWSVPPAALLEAFLPLRLNDLPLTQAGSELFLGSREPLLLSLYLGLPAVALGASALLLRAPLARSLTLAAGLSALAALGTRTPFYSLLLTLVPPLRLMRFPAKAMLLVALATALLAGLGGHELQRRRSLPLPRAWWACLSGLAALAVLAALAWNTRWSHGLLASDAALGGLRARLALATLVSAALPGLVRLPHRLGAIALPALIAGELVAVNAAINPTAPPDFYSARPPALGLVADGWQRLYVHDYAAWPARARQILGREIPYEVHWPSDQRRQWLEAAGMRLYLSSPVAGAYGLYNSYDADAMGLMSRPVADISRLVAASDGTPAYARFLEIAAVSRVVALHSAGHQELRHLASLPSFFPSAIEVFRLPRPLPRAYFVGRARRGDGAAALLDSSFDPYREVWIASLPADASGLAAPGTARILGLAGDRADVEVSSRAPGWLVLVDAYDPGWRATVDDEAAPVLRANAMFRAVPVPAGRHLVRMRYRPAALGRGLALSLASLLAWALLRRR